MIKIRDVYKNFKKISGWQKSFSSSSSSTCPSSSWTSSSAWPSPTSRSFNEIRPSGFNFDQKAWPFYKWNYFYVLTVYIFENGLIKYFSLFSILTKKLDHLNKLFFVLIYRTVQLFDIWIFFCSGEWFSRRSPSCSSMPSLSHSIELPDWEGKNSNTLDIS